MAEIKDILDGKMVWIVRKLSVVYGLQIQNPVVAFTDLYRAEELTKTLEKLYPDAQFDCVSCLCNDLSWVTSMLSDEITRLIVEREKAKG